MVINFLTKDAISHQKLTLYICKVKYIRLGGFYEHCDEKIGSLGKEFN